MESSPRPFYPLRLLLLLGGRLAILGINTRPARLPPSSPSLPPRASVFQRERRERETDRGEATERERVESSGADDDDDEVAVAVANDDDARALHPPLLLLPVASEGSDTEELDEQRVCSCRPALRLLPPKQCPAHWKSSCSSMSSERLK